MCLGNLIFGMIILSLAIEIIFEAMTMNSEEAWALDWLQTYETREKEKDAATSYLSSWWRYAALSRDASAGQANLEDDKLQEKKTSLYHNAVTGFNHLRNESSKLNSLDSYATDSSEADLTSACEDLNDILTSLPLAMQNGNTELNRRMAKVESDQQAIIAQLEALLAQ